MNKKTIVFSDGSSRGNPGPGGWAAIVVEHDTVKELGGYVERTTNNRMELTGAIEGLSNVVDKSTAVEVYTDSNYLINGITKWVFGWQRNNWISATTKEPVLNKDLWERLLSVTQRLSIEWKYVGGHSGIAGNERCDEIATLCADKKPPNLFSGMISTYPVKVLDFSHDNAKKDEKVRKGGKAFSYISLVDGEVLTHKTWADCEARVKGKKARFKKALSLDEQEQIIGEFKSFK